MDYRYTNQEAFDMAYLGIIRQGRASISGDGACQYRHTSVHGPLKCAAGHLIPDSKYKYGMENLTWRVVTGAYNDMAKLADVTFVARLQLAHDKAVVDAGCHEGIFIDAFKKYMAYIAAGYRLTVPSVY